MAKRPPQTPESEKPAVLSLTLWDCYQFSTQRSEVLAIRKEEMGRTLASFLNASGEALGDVSFVSTDLLQDPQSDASSGSSVGSTLSASERRERKFVVSQPLFQGFRALGALSGAGSLRKQREKEWERAKQLLFLDVVNAFYDYLRLAKDIEIIQGILGLFEDRLKDLDRWVEIGRSRPSEVATARSQHGVFQAELSRAKGSLAVANNLLAFLLGFSIEKQELHDEQTPLAPEGALNIMELAQRRPDVEASRQAATTARGALIIAQSELWPKITFDSNLYEHREGFQSGNSWDALFTLSVPLGKGGTTLGGIRNAASLWKEAKLTHSLTLRTAEREIKDAYENWKSAAERYQALEKAVAASQENFTFQSQEYQRHLVNNLDVLDALRSLFDARRDANQAFYEAKKNYWSLETAKGHCCAEENP